MDLIPFAAGFLTPDLSSFSRIRLLGTRCMDCEAAMAGSRRHCARCLSRKVRPIQLANRGTVLSFETQRHPPPPPIGMRANQERRIIASVELFDRGPRVVAELEGDAPGLGIGSEVNVVVGPGWRDVFGRQVVTYWFRLNDSP